MERQSGLLPDLEATHRTYMGMLMTVTTRGAPGGRNPPLSAHDWMTLLDEQAAARRAWAALFGTFDVVVAPTLGSLAFPHIADGGAWGDRTLRINGADTPFAAQLAWPGMATLAQLPSTAFPIGVSRTGLPIGVQAMGPYLEDRTTIAFAQMVEGLG